MFIGALYRTLEQKSDNSKTKTSILVNSLTRTEGYFWEKAERYVLSYELIYERSVATGMIKIFLGIRSGFNESTVLKNHNCEDSQTCDKKSSAECFEKTM